MSPRKYRQQQRWFRENPELRRVYNRRYYAKNAEIRREKARRARLANPEAVKAANNLFRERNPNYQREYRMRTKLRDAWNKWASTCAMNRREYA